MWPKGRARPRAGIGGVASTARRAAGSGGVVSRPTPSGTGIPNRGAFATVTVVTGGGVRPGRRRLRCPVGVAMPIL